MAKVLQLLKINGQEYQPIQCWAELGLTQAYMLALLSRDEYTPVATQQPTSEDCYYVDPASGSYSAIHAGQCVVYPDSDVTDGYGLSIAKYVQYDSNGAPQKVYWYHATDVEKQVQSLALQMVIIHQGCFGTGLWVNEYPWQEDAVWDNGD